MPDLGVEERNDDDAFLCLSILFLLSFFVVFSLCVFQFFFSLNSFETGGVGVGVKKGGREYY